MNTHYGTGPTSGEGQPQLIFGKYEIIRRIALGGMGEVFLARQTGVAVDRLVILKSLLPELTKQKNFINQFLNKTHITTTLNHPNIVGIYEVGLWNGQYFIAMEFIHGGDLARLQKTAAKKQVSCPYQVSARMIHDAALGLDHAHHATSMDGTPLNIVHRDISPQNIMVRGDGVTKVVDFGIAKASNRETRTATGMLKGKLQYMPPEQIANGLIDARADQFALGAVLWELTTNKRLFKAENELKTIERILKEPVPTPSSIVPGFPLDLEAVIMRMLERDPARRYPRCADVARDLQSYLDACSRSVGPAQVAEFVKGVLGEQLQEVTSNLQPSRENFLISLESGPMDAMPGGTPTTLTASLESRRKSRVTGIAAAVGLATLLFGAAAFVLFGGEEAETPLAVDPPPAPVIDRPVDKPVDDAEGVKIASAKKVVKPQLKSMRSLHKRGKKRQVVNVIRVTEPVGAKIFVDGELWPDVVPTVLKGLEPGEHKLEFELPDGEKVQAEAPVIIAKAVDKPPRSLPSEPVVKGQSITIATGPSKATVRLDGRKVCSGLPCKMADVPAGRRNITIFDGEEEYYFPVTVKETTRLLLESTPRGATVQVAGMVVGQTPFDLAKAMRPGLPVEVRVVKRGYEPWEQELALVRGSDDVKRVKLERKKAAPAPPPIEPVSNEPGFFTVRTNPWAKIAIDGEPRGSTPLFKVKLSPGKHTVRLINEGAGVKETKTITIEPGQVLKRSWTLK